MRVYLIDGTYELFRAFFAAPSWKTQHGREAGAARVMLRSLAAFMERESVTHIACAFDHVIESFRNQLFAGYKTGEGIPAELAGQFALAEDVTRALGIATWPMIDFEADDAIATAAHILAQDSNVEHVYICANDKDLTQCVRTDRVLMYDRYKRVSMDTQAVTEKFGVPPACIADWLALVGDAADGYPGIARWGRKSAATVLSAFSAIDKIPEDISLWPKTIRGAARLRDSLFEDYEAALLYRTLATLRTDVPLEASVSALERKVIDEDKANATFELLKTPRPAIAEA